MPAGFFGETLDQRPIQEATDDGDDEQEPDPEPQKMQARDTTLLPELLIAGGEPGQGVDQPPEGDRPKTSDGPDHQGHDHEPETRATQRRGDGPDPLRRLTRAQTDHGTHVFRSRTTKSLPLPRERPSRSLDPVLPCCWRYSTPQSACQVPGAEMNRRTGARCESMPSGPRRHPTQPVPMIR